MSSSLVCLGEITGAHGLKGHVKIRLFGDNPDALVDYSPLLDEKGKESFAVLMIKPHGDQFRATLEGVNDRNASEALRGQKLYVPRDRLAPPTDDRTFYHVDLMGLAARDTDGSDLGKVVQVANFGAGDLLEIKPKKGTSFYLPFTDAVVPEVNIDGGFVVIDPPPGLMD